MKKTNAINLSKTEVTVLPFPHFNSTCVLEDEADTALHYWLEESAEWKLVKTDFYEQFEFNFLDVSLPPNLKFLADENTISLIGSTLTTLLNAAPLGLVGIVAHKLIDGHRIGIHNDFINEEETHRFVIHLNPTWEEDNGGFLMLFNSSDAKDISKIVSPINNSAFGFEISRKSHHAVSQIHDFSRYTLVYTFKTQ